MKNIRTCIACKNKFNKNDDDLIKITKNNDKIIVNYNQKIFGRSCYICNNAECIKKIIDNKLLSKVFKQPVNNSVYDELLNYKR